MIRDVIGDFFDGLALRRHIPINTPKSTINNQQSSFIIHHSSFIIHHSSFIIHHSSIKREPPPARWVNSLSASPK
jgi:hypothetical protein